MPIYIVVDLLSCTKQVEFHKHLRNVVLITAMLLVNFGSVCRAMQARNRCTQIIRLRGANGGGCSKYNCPLMKYKIYSR